MCLFLVLYWCSAVVKRCGGPNIFADNSRFGDFNSRLGRRKFPLRAATGISWQALDLAHCFYGQMAVIWAKSTKFPVSTGKTGNLAPVRERPVARAPDNHADLRAFASPAKAGFPWLWQNTPGRYSQKASTMVLSSLRIRLSRFGLCVIPLMPREGGIHRSTLGRSS